MTHPLPSPSRKKIQRLPWATLSPVRRAVPWARRRWASAARGCACGRDETSLLVSIEVALSGRPFRAARYPRPCPISFPTGKSITSDRDGQMWELTKGLVFPDWGTNFIPFPSAVPPLVRVPLL